MLPVSAAAVGVLLLGEQVSAAQAGAFALAMAVSLGCTRHNRVLVALAWTAALAMAWSRVHLGVHFPSDVLAGALVGMLSAILIWRAAHALRQRRWLRLGRLRKRLAPGI